MDESLTNRPRRALHKIKSLDDLAEIVRQMQKAGDTVVLCHGTFDLLHLGHVRHLQASRNEGTRLVVTVTADAYVNKGPGRPVFSQMLRAEMLAAIEIVDYVAINEAPTAENVLATVRPDIYVKGSDYRDDANDVTGKIVAEREVIESYGGRVVFTDEATYSSSSLINKYLNLHEPSLQSRLNDLRDDNALDRYLALVDKIADYKVLIVGDTIVDEYQYVAAIGRSAKESMLATQFKNREVFAGGVIAAANHLASFCREVEVVTAIGGYESYENMIRSSLRPNVKLSAVQRRDKPTTRKCRFVDTGYSVRKLFEVYVMDDSPLSDDNHKEFMDLLAAKVEGVDLVIVTDFGHGLMGPQAIDLLIEKAPFLAVNAQSNSANHGFNLITKYRKADYICIDEPEAQLAVHDKYASSEAMATKLLPSAVDCPKIVVTQGKRGCTTFDRESGLNQMPALTSVIVDTVGAGDAFFVLTAPFVRAGAAMPDVGLLGNAAGAIKVGIIGHRSSVEKVAYVKFLTALLK